VDLPRGAELYVMVPDFIDDTKQIFIPDAASANLVDVVFPYPYSVAYTDAGTPTTSIILAPGASKVLDITGLLRSGVAAEPLTSFVQYAAVTGLTLTLTDTTFTITGGTTGIYSVVPSAVAESFLLPEPTISGTLAVEVT
jgi:hypothetical protein